MHLRRRWFGPTATLMLLVSWGLAAPPAAATPGAGGDSLRTALPFVPIREAGDQFAASPLSKTYSRDLLHLLNPAAARIRADLDLLDRYGKAPRRVVPVDDSSDVHVVDAGERDEISPEEKKKLEPPGPPVKTAIPDAVASTASVIGGLALLVKLLSEMIR